MQSSRFARSNSSWKFSNADPRITHEDRASFLASIDLFSDLAEDELLALARDFSERSFDKEEVVFHEADTSYYFYVVASGRVRVSRMLPTGKEMVLAFHESGEHFGELALVDGEMTPASVVAAEPTTILLMPSRRFAPLIQHPRINRRLMSMLCSCCRTAWRQVGLLNAPTAESRVRAALHQIALERGLDTKDGISISMRLTHREIADYVGISRETATRIVNDLQSKEILLVRAQHFVIPQMDSLFPGQQIPS